MRPSKAINEGRFIGCVMIDFWKAFGTVDHKILLKKKVVISVVAVLV